MRIEMASAAAAERHLPALTALLVSLVNDGASIGWIPPMKPAAAELYWRDRIAAVERGDCALLLAFAGDALVGTAQLGLAQRENGSHRAEVQKVLVHRDHRRRGIGKQLMRALEDCAVRHGRSLLFLDTREGDPAEQLYQQMGYGRVGVIPRYVRNAAGDFEGTVVYYKILEGSHAAPV